MIESSPTDESTPANEPVMTVEADVTHEALLETYEAILDAAKKLHEQGVDPFEHDDYSESSNVNLVLVWDSIQNWSVRNCREDYDIGGMETSEQARAVNSENAANIVKIATIWIDAGYTTPAVIQEASDYLLAEEKIAEPAGDEVVKVFSDAIEKLNMLTAEKEPKKTIPLLIEAAIAEANEYVAQNKLIDAIPVLTAILIGAKYQKFLNSQKNAAKKEELTQLRDSIKERWIAEGRKTS